MDAKEKENIVLQCSASYLLKDSNGKQTAAGESNIQLYEDSVSVLPEFGQSIIFSYRDIININPDNYKIHLVLTSNEVLTLSNLGYTFEDFLRVLLKMRNQVIIIDLLMNESLKTIIPAAEYEYFTGNDIKKSEGTCSIRLYETAFVVISEKEEFLRIPYSYITEVKSEDLTFEIKTELNQKFIFLKLGREFDYFKKTLSDLMNALSMKIQSSLKELVPQANPLVIRRISELMKEGKAAKRSDIESLSKELWIQLEKKIESLGIKEEYEFLKSLSQKDKISIGLKRDLMGDLTGDYIWFLIPIYSINAKQPGNLIAMESITEKETGKATYFFRITGRKDYVNFKDINNLHKEADNFIMKINRAMITINFRREPIYLPDEKLEEPDYLKYKFAAERIPELKTLREFFIGRVIHRSDEQWKKDVQDLINFNVTSVDDKIKWKKDK